MRRACDGRRWREKKRGEKGEEKLYDKRKESMNAEMKR